MAQDYTEFTDLADELIPFFGRNVTFRRLPDDSPDPSTPWLSSDDWDDSSPPADHKVTCKAVSTGAFSGEEMKELSSLFSGLVPMASDGFLVQGPAAIGVDLTLFHSVEDNGQMMSIKRCLEAKPGDTVICYWVEVDR